MSAFIRPCLTIEAPAPCQVVAIRAMPETLLFVVIQLNFLMVLLVGLPRVRIKSFRCIY